MTDETNKPGHNDDFPKAPGGQKVRRAQTGAGSSFGDVHDDMGDSPISPSALESLADELGVEGFEGSADFAEALRSQFDDYEKQQADLADRLAKAQEEIHRYQAEIQNLHRRREKEAEDAGKYAITKFAQDTVEVADNFERAIASVPADATNDNPVLKSLLDGVTMTERQFLTVLEKHGVKRISPKDELFDPHQHQAMMEQEDKAVPAGTILQVYQSGYIIADRVLRPAMVVVAKGGPKPVKPEPTEEVEAAATQEASAEPQAGDSGDPPVDETTPTDTPTGNDTANDNS